MTDIEKLKKIVAESKKIVFFGGAGVSTASGIPDFRGSNGIYKNVDAPERILSGDYFATYPQKFYQFYRSKMLFPNAEPNIVHTTLAKWENSGKLLAVVTQNIDGLHQKAGSKNVIELHGTVLKNHCTKCGAKYSLDYVLSTENIPLCSKCGGIIKPDVVLYGEALDGDAIEQTQRALQCGDTLIIAGTSLTVQPAASMVCSFVGKNKIIINKTKTAMDGIASLCIYDDLAKVFAQLND